LRLELEQECAYWSGEAGDAAGARDRFAALVPVLERVVGAEHPDTLTARHNLAYLTGAAGNVVAARDQFASLVPVRERVLGSEHPNTLTSRHNLAHWTAAAGDPAGACELAGQLLADYADLSDLPRALRSATTGVLIHNLERALAVRAESRDQAGAVADLGIVGLLQAAIHGSAEALVRLPSELVPIVEELRTERAGGRPSVPTPA
jgi:hypothetical protein